MRTILASSTVFVTILFSVAFGIALGYVLILAILRTFSRRPQTETPATATHAAMATLPSSH